MHTTHGASVTRPQSDRRPARSSSQLTARRMRTAHAASPTAAAHAPTAAGPRPRGFSIQSTVGGRPDIQPLSQGTQHSVWQIREADGSPSGRVLRIPRCASAEAPSDSSFVQRVLTPLLGDQYVHPSPARLALPEELARELSDAKYIDGHVSPAAAGAVVSAAAAAIAGGGGDGPAVVLLDTDHTVLRLPTPECISPGLCIELKPKAGVLPPPKSPLGMAHPGVKPCGSNRKVTSEAPQPHAHLLL